MNDRAMSLLEQYDVEVLRSRKGRGTFICDTKQGTIVLKEYSGSPEKLALQQQILQRIRELGLVQAEELLITGEGELCVKNYDDSSYIVKTYVEGRECNIYDPRECIEAMQQLARLHHCMEGVGELALQPYSPLREYEKHNRELQRVRTYLKKRGNKQAFERRLLEVMEYFAEQANQVTESWRSREQEPGYVYCHGDYQYHNILRSADGWHIVNFEKLQRDHPVRDVCLFLRKVMEKNNWSLALGRDMLGAYEAIRRLDAYAKADLYHRFAYPEKFWKIANFYYNSGKAWIPEKNLEKLEKVISQEQEKQRFLDEVFR